MRFSLFLESKSINYYHGSDKRFKIGMILTPQSEQHDTNWGINKWYRILEKQRPKHMLARNNAVYMFSNLDDFDSGLASDRYIYQVQPLGKVERHDANWISELEMRLDLNYDDNGKIVECAKNYWEDKPHTDEQLWEYLTPSAKILKLVETNI